MEWFKTYQDGILRGSLSTSNDVVQLIWVKLLAIENETRLRDGWLHFKKGCPMSREYLAMVCNVSVEDINVALEEFLDDLDKDGHSRIEIADDGDIFIKNWERYQSKPVKILTKENSIDNNKRRSRSMDTNVLALTREVNRLTVSNYFLANKIKGNPNEYTLTENGDIVHVDRGDILVNINKNGVSDDSDKG